jgi:hypothetical protein
VPIYGGEPPMFDMPTKGAIVMDAFDGSSAAQVWHGSGEAMVDANGLDYPLLRASVHRMLASFPARGTRGRPGRLRTASLRLSTH